MKKSVSLFLALMLALACALPAFAESTATQFPALGMEITLPENAADMGLDVIAREDLMNLTFQDEETFTALLLVERMDNALYEQLMADEAWLFFLHGSPLLKIFCGRINMNMALGPRNV